MVKVCVLGATGYIGFAVAKRFSSAGFDVFGVCRSEEKALRLKQHEITPVIADLDDPTSYQDTLEECSIIIHCAADYQNMKEVDKKIISAICQAGRDDAGQKQIIISSGVWIYGGHENAVIDESTPDNPPELIAWRTEHEEEVLCTPELRSVTVLRTGIVYGAAGSLTGVLFSQGMRGKIDYVGNGSNYMTMVHIEDLAECYLNVVQANQMGPKVYVIGGSNVLVSEVLRNVARVTGTASERITYSEPRDDFGVCLALDQRADSAKARLELKWQPRHRPFIDAIERYYEAFRAHYAS